MLRLCPDDVESLDAYAADLYHRGEEIRGQDPKGALELFQQELVIEQDAARSYTDLSMTFEQMGDYRHGLDSDLWGLDIYKRILSTDPQNSLLKRGTAIAYINTATAYRQLGRRTESAKYTRPALELMRELVRVDSSNRQNQGLMAAVAVAAPYNFMATEKPDEAMRDLEEGCAVYKSIFNASPSEPGALAKLAYCDTAMGDAARIAGNWHDAESFHNHAITRGRCLDSNPTDDQVCVAVAHAYEGMGDLNRRLADGTSAPGCGRSRQWYQNSIAAWEKISHPDAVDKYSFEMGSRTGVEKKLQACGR